MKLERFFRFDFGQILRITVVTIVRNIEMANPLTKIVTPHFCLVVFRIFSPKVSRIFLVPHVSQTKSEI